MWFKNLRVFCLTQPFDLPLEDFEAQLTEQAFTPCANYEKSRIGWVSPLGNDAPVAEDEDVAKGQVGGDHIRLVDRHAP